ncbi:hypothetical protein NDU88_001456 [Pleurodeles waltl]|uniref:Uncharacterized protein n=1 Tax=Pleurodeles waltl TaxID=8319 RepID=A0AAV7KTH2_PLEWA|nr:hypothetical protein NDU88_001456 [Pleurodeles waltl]
MCRLTGGVVEGRVSAAGAVLWSRAALELRKTRSAVVRFPLRGRSSGSNSSSGRVSTSTLLTLEQRVDDGAYSAYAAEVKGGSSTAQTAEETVGLVRSRGRRRRGEKSLSSSKETAPSGEVNVRVVSDDFRRLMEVEEGAQPSVIMAMEKVGAEVRVEETVVLDKGEKTKDQCPVSAVNSESQEEQSGETPPVTMVNNNHAPGISQLLRMEDGEGTARVSPMEEMITRLAEEIKKGFSVSEANQASIKEGCEILETKFDLLARRTQFLEETVESLKEDVVQIKQDLRESRACEQDLQDKLERLENAARRNNLRILNIPEGVEGNDIKAYFTSLIKNSLQLEETEQDIASDIQRIHRNPFRRDSGRKKPQKVLINFLNYALKGKILLKALKQKTLGGMISPLKLDRILREVPLINSGNWEIALRISRSWMLQRNSNSQPPCE